jgi:hypothetical protein
MKKIPIEYKKKEGDRWFHLSTLCPNGIGTMGRPCYVGSAYCLKECKYCDRKNSVDYKYVMCKLENKQLNLFDQ